jgi:hypothetical protein
MITAPSTLDPVSAAAATQVSLPAVAAAVPPPPCDCAGAAAAQVGGLSEPMRDVLLLLLGMWLSRRW